jgi:hypothetical protein
MLLGHLIELTFPSCLDASALEHHALKLRGILQADKNNPYCSYEGDILYTREGNVLRYIILSEFAEDLVHAENVIRKMGQGRITYRASDFVNLRKIA